MFRIRILDRYIFTEILPPFFLSMAALTLVLLLQRMYKLAELVVSRGATVGAVVKLLLYVLPGFFVIIIPMSLLVASLTAFTRLSSDSEITAMKASRISLYVMMRPLMAFALICFLATAATSLVLVPTANFALKKHLFNMVKSRSMVGIEAGVFSSTFDGMVMYVDKMESLDRMEGIFISDERSTSEPYVIIAKRGKLTADQSTLKVTLAMNDGSIHALPRDETSYSLMSFDAGKLYLDINQALVQKNSQEKSMEETGSLELLRQLKIAKTEGKPTIDLESEFHKRIAIPFACVIFGLIGAPLGIRQSRSGKSAGIAVALMVFLFYYFILAAGTKFADAGTLAPIVAYWLPNLLLTAAAAALVFMKGHEISFDGINRINACYALLKRAFRRSP